MKSVKYILLITLILFIFVFLVTLPGRLNANKVDDSSSVSEPSSTGTSASDTTQSVATSVQNGTSAIIVGGDATTTTAATAITTTGEKSMEANDQWAFFLINQTNPLPDNYSITTKKVFGRFEMDDRCADYMINMIADAKTAGVNLNIISAYRSVEYQQTLFDNDTKKYENQGLSHDEAVIKTSQAVAIPGQSEHNAGICADILDDGNFNLTEDFENTDEFKWLSENADKYGFILRYLKGKESITGIEYEPWHYRFVGVSYAKKIKDSGLCLEEYYKQQ